MTKPSDIHRIRIGMLGSGTVGEALQELIFNGDLEGKLGISFEIPRIYTRDPKRKSWYPKHPTVFTTRPEEVTDHPEVDVVVEVLGSQDERDHLTFKGHIIRALEKGKSVVTSDKAVLAKFGEEIWQAARQHKQAVRFEACVGGGIPIIRSLAEGLIAERPEAIYGIINGTCNYILSAMEKGGRSLEQALRNAQEYGYAEPNPMADTSGNDAEAKLILLTAVTFGVHVKPGVLYRKGINEIQPIDFLYAGRKGSSTIRHLVVARRQKGKVEAFVSPVLVPKDHFLCSIEGPMNAVFFRGGHGQERTGGGGREKKLGDRSWDYVFIGPGAGGGPTATAILGDIFDLARGRERPFVGLPSLVEAGKLSIQSEDEIESCFYLRFLVKDRPGIVGDICQTLGKEGINISEVWQLSHSEEELSGLVSLFTEDPGKILPFVITLERANVGQIRRALQVIRQRDFIRVDPLLLPLWRN